MAEYELFVVTGLSELKQDEETVVEVRSVDTLEMRRVKAILSSSAKGLPGADTLWIRGERGMKYPEPWAIKIIEDLGTLGDSVVKEFY